MLDNTAKDIKSGEVYNAALAKSISGVLSGLGLGVKRCCCILDKDEKMRVEAVLDAAPEAPVSRAKMREAISGLCGRDFATPEITRADKEYLLTLCERTEFEVEYASVSIKSDSSKICGDNAEHFFDGKGHSYMIISDGMGTGTRAAVDSRMATALSSRLISAGFDFSPMLKLINTAMMYRSGEESLATLDIAEINLYSGEVSLYKAGSAPTLIRKSKRAVKAECHSLPLGILRNVEFHKVCSKLASGDIVLMMSDGATLDGTDWISNELECFEGSAKSLCEMIAKEAKRRRTDGRSDDITVSAAIIHKQI
jgi:stage II sporulation protein E